MLRAFFLVALAVACGGGGPGWAADSGEGVLTGRVTKDGQGVPAVVVTASGPVDARAATMLDGAYRFAGLPDGTYTVAVTQDGFEGSPAVQTILVQGQALGVADFQVSPVASVLPTIRLTPSATRLRSGDTLALRMTITPGSQETVADVHLVVLGPGTPLRPRAPWQGNVQVPPVTDLPVFTHTVTGSDAPGTYTWLAFFTRPGTLEVLGSVASAAVTIQP